MDKKTKSGIMKVYNTLKNDMKGEKPNDMIEIGRLNKGLGLAIGELKDKNYSTTMDVCLCPDKAYRGQRYYCKHQMAYFMLHPDEFFLARFMETL